MERNSWSSLSENELDTPLVWDQGMSEKTGGGPRIRPALRQEEGVVKNNERFLWNKRTGRGQEMWVKRRGKCPLRGLGGAGVREGDTQPGTGRGLAGLCLGVCFPETSWASVGPRGIGREVGHLPPGLDGNAERGVHVPLRFEGGSGYPLSTLRTFPALPLLPASRPPAEVRTLPSKQRQPLSSPATPMPAGPAASVNTAVPATVAATA